MMEERKEALLRESLESNSINPDLNRKLAQLDLSKPRPYGTLHAVSILPPTFTCDVSDVIWNLLTRTWCLSKLLFLSGPRGLC